MGRANDAYPPSRRSGTEVDEQQIGALIIALEKLLRERPKCGGIEAEAAAGGAAAGRAGNNADLMARAAPFLSALPHRAPPAHTHEPSSAPTGFPQGRAAQAREMIRLRRMRTEHLPASLFGEPAWDMLLDLYAAAYEGKKVCVSSLCLAAAVPSTTALRAIESLTGEGYISRCRDPADGRRIFLMLTDAARSGLDAYFDAVSGSRH